MTVPIDGLDHTIVGVRDLEAARQRWARLGFTLTPRGRHFGWGTANYCIMFPEDYIELLGIVDPAEFTNNLDAFLAHREGLLSLAFRTGDADAVAAALAGKGIAAEGPKDLARDLELPGGTVQPRFKLLFPDARATPALSAFVCQHLTPELMRRAEWLDHANGARAIAAVTVLAEDPPALAPAYEALLGAGAAVATDDVLTVHTGRGLLQFVRPDDLDMLHPQAQPSPDLAAPALFAMTLAADPDRAARHLDAAGVPVHRLADTALSVAPEDATGVLLEFAPPA